MEKKSEEGLLEQPKYYEHLRYDPMETRNEGIVPASQRILQEPTSSVFTVARPPEYASSGVKPVLNYSIQTGEEFAFEFMRDRANPRKQFIPNAAGDQNTATGYMDLKGILGISHTGSESGSDVSMLVTGETKSVKDLDKKGSYESDNKSYYESTRSVRHAASRGGNSRGFSHGYTSSGTSDGSLMKMKVLCSFGGKILPRPSDGKLRYVGGDTRIIRINKDISWQELMQKTSTIYNQAHTIKYQLPGEDLDALVSVSSDEDLQNMMEECNLLEGGEQSQKLRMFLFSSSELDDAHFGLGSSDGDSETQYVVAVNGMDLGPRKGSNGHGLESTSGNGLDQLLSFNIGRDRQTVGTSSAPLPGIPVPPSNTLSNQIQGSSFNGYETHMKAYQDRMMDHMENEHHPFSTAQPFDSFNDGRHKTFVPSSMPPQYNYSSQYAPSVESPLPVPLHELVSLRQEGLTEGKHSDGGFRVKDAEVPVKEVKLTTDSSTQPKNENEHLPHLEQYDSSVPNHRPAEVSFIPPAPESKTSPMPPQHDEKRLEPLQVSVPTSAVNASQTHVSNDNDDYFTSAGSFASGTANSEVDPTDFNYYEPPLRPQRVFHSERIPREQAELQNRLSKSDDNISSQFPIPHSRSGLAQQEPITESVDPLHEDNPNSHAEQSILSAKEPQINPLTVEGGLMQFEKYKELADAINQMNQHVPDEHLNSAQISTVNDHLQQPSPEEASVFGSDNPSAGPDTAIKLQENPVSPPQELHWGDVTTNATGSNSIVTMGQAPPFAAWAVSSAGGVSRDESFVHDATPERGDILIDINDRFPPDLLSDLFSKARFPDDSTGISPLRHDDTGLSLNMQNPEPKRWSFFRKLAPDEFIRKDVSLMDQDHIGFPHPLAKVEEGTTKHYGFSPLELERAGLGHVESQIDFDEEIQQESSGIVGANTNAPHPDYIPSQVITDLHLLDKDNEAVQADDISFSKLVGNVRTDSEYEEGKIEAGHIGGPIADPLLSDFDIDIIDLQYVLRDSTKNTSGKEGSTYLLMQRRDDQQLSEKSVAVGAATEILEDEAVPATDYGTTTGVSGAIDIGKKRLLLKGKEKELSLVSGVVSPQQSITVRNSQGSAAFKQNQRRERDVSGRIIRSILSNKDARHNQSPVATLQSEQQMQTVNLEKDKRPPRPNNIRSILKDHVSPHAVISDGDTKRASDDKFVSNDLHNVTSVNEKQDRRTRNKDRPDRGVWTPLRRSDGSHASDGSLPSSSLHAQFLSDSFEGMTISQQAAAGVSKTGDDVVEDMDSSSNSFTGGKPRSMDGGHNSRLGQGGGLLSANEFTLCEMKVDMPNASKSGEIKVIGTGLVNGSHRHVVRRGPHGLKEIDGSPNFSEGKPSKRGGTGYGSHEKQVWVQKSGSGS